MKGIFRRLVIALALSVCLTLSAFGCSAAPTWTGEGVVGFQLPHVSPKPHQGDAGYNSDLFYLNEATILGPDPGAIYVSDQDVINSYQKRKSALQYGEGEDAGWIDGWSDQRFIEEYGTLAQWTEKYANRYFCSNTSWARPSEQEKQEGIVCTDFIIYQASDLVNWKMAGALDSGTCVAVYEGDWMTGSYAWAPEFRYDQESGLFFIFYSAQARCGGVGSNLQPETDYNFDLLTVSCAISQTPTGPYKVATAETYLSAITKKNADGSPVRGSQPKPSADMDRDGSPDKQLYEIYAQSDGRVVGYVDLEGEYYTLNGYVIDEKTPVLNTGYYYPRMATNQSKVEEFERTYHVTNLSGFEDSGIDNCIWPSIDANPVEDSQGNKYLYFCQHKSSFNTRNEIWVVAMKDWLTPDWDTLTRIATPGHATVSQNGTLAGVGDGTSTGEGLNEGGHVIEHDGKWFFTYAPVGYGSAAYSVQVAVADSPFGPFTKLLAKYSPVIGVGEEPINGVGGTGHHCFISVGEELWAIYHSFANGGNVQSGRSFTIDRIIWKYDPDLGYEMMFGNGPTINLQPKPESYTGYRNVATSATISGNGDTGAIENVSDGMFTAQPFSRKFEYGKSDGDLKVSLKWDKPVTVKAFMIYTSGDAYKAFSKVDYVVLKLATKPSWYDSEGYNGYCYIKDLTVDSFEYIEKNIIMRKGASAIAEFNPVEICEMHVYISGGKDGKFINEDEDGNPSSWVNISEIYIFGN